MVKKLFKELVAMFKRDFETLELMFSNPTFVKKHLKTIFKGFSVKEHFKAFWMIYLVFVCCFLAGYFVAGVRLNNMCVDYITEFIIPENPSSFPGFNASFLNLTLN